MLTDFDEEMERRSLAGVLVVGDSTYGNPDLYYVIGTHLTRGGFYARKIHEQPVLITSDIDIGTAGGGRVRNIRSLGEFSHQQLMEQHGPVKGRMRFFDKILKDLGFDGRIGLYGSIAASEAVALADELRRHNHNIVGDPKPHLIESLRETKDEQEMAKIRHVAAGTEKVVRQTREYLQDCKIRNNTLYDHGSRLTVSRVKQRIKQLLMENELDAPEGTIFAVGAETADPHNVGKPATPVKAGVPIVFDIFPQQQAAYWFDTTRTYCIGRPSKRLQTLYNTVLEAQQAALDAIKAGVPNKEVADLVCDIFEKKGHKTYRYYTDNNIPRMSEGFIHGLGHGIGLTIGEPPSLRSYGSDQLKQNHVTTVEPGLYYPEFGGARLEDVVVVTKKGIDNLSTLDKTLQL